MSQDIELIDWVDDNWDKLSCNFLIERKLYDEFHTWAREQYLNRRGEA